MTKAEQRVAVADLQHIVTVLQIGIGSNQCESSRHTLPILRIGFGVMERVRILQPIACSRKTIPAHDLVVGLHAVRPSRRIPCLAHVDALEVPVELLAKMHVTDQRRTRIAGLLIDVENTLGGHLGTCGVGTVGRGERHALKPLPRLDGVSQTGFGQRRIRPALQLVIPIKERLPMANQMQVKNHASHATRMPF